MTAMEKQITITIDGEKITAEAGKTILAIAREHNIYIPSLCYHEDVENRSSCRLCLVEIKGRRGLLTSCTTKAEDGMEIATHNEKIAAARKTNLELLLGQHGGGCEDGCGSCSGHTYCHLHELAKEMDVAPRFEHRKKDEDKIYCFGPSIEFDPSKCIDCGNCVSACGKQTGFLERKKNGEFFEITPSENPKVDCIYCGQCLEHCPVGAFDSVQMYEDVADILDDKNIKTIFQFAPSIRTSIGEEFGMEPGEVVTDKLSAAIRALGAYRVFDTSVGADFTTMEEADELLEHAANGTGPCLTSCCPSWVKFIEFYHPEYVKNLATSRSPQMIVGVLTKTYYAEKENLDPKKIRVVSVMPCTSKKYEAIRDDMTINGMHPVDFSLTTRELAQLLKERNIDLKTIAPEPADNPFGIPSGAGVIYGASGGVVESALRTAYFKATGKNLAKLEVKAVRGQTGIKKASVAIGKKKVRIAIVSGIDNARKILEELKENPHAYDGVEVMACPGGCIGGGGQPLPNTPAKRKARAEALYSIDDKAKLRLAHESEVIKTVYGEFLKNKKMRHAFCHTKFSKKKKEVKFK